jgi:hypothetical protein
MATEAGEMPHPNDKEIHVLFHRELGRRWVDLADGADEWMKLCDEKLRSWCWSLEIEIGEGSVYGRSVYKDSGASETEAEARAALEAATAKAASYREELMRLFRDGHFLPPGRA